MRDINLKSPKTIEDLRSIQNVSTPSDITILFGALEENRQTLFLPAKISSNVSTASEAPPKSREGSVSLLENNETAAADILALGSYTKTLLG